MGIPVEALTFKHAADMADGQLCRVRGEWAFAATLDSDGDPVRVLVRLTGPHTGRWLSAQGQPLLMTLSDGWAWRAEIGSISDLEMGAPGLAALCVTEAGPMISAGAENAPWAAYVGLDGRDLGLIVQSARLWNCGQWRAVLVPPNDVRIEPQSLFNVESPIANGQ
jgi:hypothetical protein